MTGSLQVKNDIYYAVLNTYEDGQRKPKWISTQLKTRGNKRKAEAILAKLLQEYEQQQQAGAAGQPDILFLDYLPQWLATAKPSLATATVQSYNNMITSRIESWFRPKKIKLRELKPAHLQAFYNSILEDGCTTNTVIHYHAVIQRALHMAVKRGLLLRNPADQVERPKKNPPTHTFYSKEEVRELLEVIEGDPLDIVVTIAAYYGLRRSEILGLRWQAVDFENGTLHINHKVIEVKENGKFVPKGEDVLKTKSSIRSFPLIPAVEKKLREQKERQEIYRRVFKSAYCKEYLDYVCLNELGQLMRPNYVTEHFTYLLKKYNLKVIRFHDLRHTCASLLLAAGENMKNIQTWLGHSNFSTTADIYTHVDYQMKQGTAHSMSTMFDAPGKPVQNE